MVPNCLRKIVVSAAAMMLLSTPALSQTAGVDPRVLPFDPQKTSNELDALRQETVETQGALIVSPNEVIAKAPLLKALITVDDGLSPYALDAKMERPIDLRSSLQLALVNNWDIKISNTNLQTKKWGFYGAIGNFLPSLSYSFTNRYLYGTYASPFGLVGHANTDNIVMPAAISTPIFQGGGLIFNYLTNKHTYRASQFALKGTTNDVLFQAGKLYYRLLEADVLLQVRIKAVQSARAILARSQVRYQNGTNTKLDVLQAKTHLSKMRQALIAQQVARRDAAVKLATALAMDPTADLTPQDRNMMKIDLIDQKVSIADLIQIAVDNRPELKQYEELRLAAKNNLKLAISKFAPQVSGSVGQYMTGAKAVNPSTSGSSNNAVEAGGPTLDAVGDAPASSSSGGRGGGRKSFHLGEMFQVGVTVNFALGGLGTQELAQAQAAKWQARKAQMEFSKELQLIWQEVRTAYLEVLNAKNMIYETTDMVASAEEEVEVANTRLTEGVGTDLDVIDAEKDYTTALIDKANAIANYNVAQASLLRAIGKTSVATMTASTPLNKTM